MTTNLKVGNRFPDSELLNHENELIKLSNLTQSGLMERYLGFTDGYPLILLFYRGFFCPRVGWHWGTVQEWLATSRDQGLEEMLEVKQKCWWHSSHSSGGRSAISPSIRGVRGV